MATQTGQGWSYQRIADELGFASKGHAHNAVTRAFAEIPTESAEQAKALDLERIDRLIEWNTAVMLKPHLAHSNGRVVRHITGVELDGNGKPKTDADGKPVYTFEDVLDDGPGQASAREVRALVERRAKIFGYDAPARSRVEVITAEMIEAQIAELESQVPHDDLADPGTS
jgi:hypothetical protein